MPKYIDPMIEELFSKQRNAKILTRFSIASLYGLNQSVGLVFRFIVSWLVFYYAAPAIWGNFIKVGLVLQLFVFLTSFGQRDYLIKEFSLNPKDINKDWVACTFSRLPILLLALIILRIFFLESHLNTALSLWLICSFFNSSFNVINLYKRDFKFSFYAELVTGSILLLTTLIYRSNISVFVLVSATAAGQFLKALAYFFRYYRLILVEYCTFKISYIKNSFSFFLPSLVGVIQSRIDLYFIALLISAHELAYYTVFMSIIGLAYSIISFAITPFSKNIYRLTLDSVRKMQKTFLIGTLLLSAPFILIGSLVIEYYYKYELPTWFYILGFINISSFSVYVIIINKLFRINKQQLVSKVPMGILVFQIPLSILLISSYGLSGAIAVNSLGHLVGLGCFIYLDKKYFPISIQHL